MNEKVFAYRLKAWRLEHDLSQEELAKLLGTTKQTLSRWETGAIAPKISRIPQMAEALGVDEAWIAGYEHSEDSTINAKWDGTLQRLKDDEGILLSTYRELNEDDRKFLQRQIELLRRERERGDA